MPVQLDQVLARPVAFHPILTTVTGSSIASIVLSQAIYWDRIVRKAMPDRLGWWYKTADEWREETGLLRSELEKGVAVCLKRGFLFKEKRGQSNKSHYKVNWDGLQEALGGLLLGGLFSLPPSALESLERISRAAHMRAVTIQPNSKFVSLVEVLEQHGTACAVCGEAMGFPGPGPEALAFAYVKPLRGAGRHTVANLRGVHRKCQNQPIPEPVETKEQNRFASNKQSREVVDSEGPNRFASNKQSGLLQISKAVCLHEANPSYMHETTTDITTFPAANADGGTMSDDSISLSDAPSLRIDNPKDAESGRAGGSGPPQLVATKKSSLEKKGTEVLLDPQAMDAGSGNGAGRPWTDEFYDTFAGYHRKILRLEYPLTNPGRDFGALNKLKKGLNGALSLAAWERACLFFFNSHTKVERTIHHLCGNFIRYSEAPIDRFGNHDYALADTLAEQLKGDEHGTLERRLHGPGSLAGSPGVNGTGRNNGRKPASSAEVAASQFNQIRRLLEQEKALDSGSSEPATAGARIRGNVA